MTRGAQALAAAALAAPEPAPEPAPEAAASREEHFSNALTGEAARQLEELSFEVDRLQAFEREFRQDNILNRRYSDELQSRVIEHDRLLDGTKARRSQDSLL